MDIHSFVVMRVVFASAVVAVVFSTVGASAATRGANGKLCGSAGCVPLPTRLATSLSQRNESFSSVPQPKPQPFYRVTITARGEGFINRTIIWVPSLNVWFLKEYVTPPIPGYWRTPNKAATPALEKLAKSRKPFVAPMRWPRVLPR